MRYLFIIALLFISANLDAQVLTYNAPTSVTKIDLPSPIPCPYSPGTGCTANNGSLTGANYQVTGLTDFPNTTLVRMTDNSTAISGHSFNTSCDASSEQNDWNALDNRFTICESGNNQMLFSFNTSTNQGTAVNTSWLNAYSNSAWFSFTQNYILYHAHLSAGNDPSIYSYDTTACSTSCTPSATLVVDLATSCSIAAITGNASAAFGEGISVSGDDQTFGALVSTSASQGTGIYVITWNRTTGCTYWNTNTGHWFIGAADQGTVGTADTFTLHNVRIGKGGTWVKVSPQSCVGTCLTNGNYFWQVGTSTVTSNDGLGDGCGHTAIGYTHWVNKCNGGTNVNGLFSATNASPNSQTSLPSSYPSPERAQGAHISWSNDNSSDTAPFIAMFEDDTNFTITDGWDNEIVAVSTGGSGTVYRLAHTFANPAVSLFVPGSVSADGKYVLWTTDWDGMVGNTDGVSASCTPGSNCRTDVFVAALPLNSSSTGSTFAGKIGAGVTIQ